MKSGIEFIFKLADTRDKITFDDGDEAILLDWVDMNKIRAADDCMGILYEGNELSEDCKGSYARFTFKWQSGSLVGEQKIAVKLH